MTRPRKIVLSAALLAALLPAGCGTLTAVVNPRGEPLIYLGAQRDIEFLQTPFGSLLCFCVLADTAVSAVLDTLVLPYGLIREAALTPDLEEGVLVEERPLWTLPQHTWGPTTFGREADHAAVRLSDGNREWIWIDGNAGPFFRQVFHRIAFSEDGSRRAYGARDDAGWRMVVDGKSGDRFDRVESPRFSPDGKRVAFAAKRDGRAFVVVDGVPGEPFDEVGDLAWSPDGAAPAFAARLDRSWFMVRGTEKGPSFGRVAAPTFSPDGRRFAYAMLPESPKDTHPIPATPLAWRLILDGREESLSAYPRSLVFSEDGKDIAWSTREDWKDYLFVSGRKQGPFESLGRLAFRPGGKDVAFSMTRGHRDAVVTPEGEIGMFRCIASGPVWSPDGRRVAFEAWRKEGDDYRPFVVAGRKKSPEYDEVRSLGWSADGSSVFFGARRGRDLLRVVMRAD